MRAPLYLKVVLKGRLGETPSPWWATQRQTSLLAVLSQLHRARENKRTKAILLVIRPTSLSWSQAEEIAEALERCREAGKKLYCFIEAASNASYYLACAADHVALAPAGSVDLVGLSSEGYYLQKPLQRLGVRAQMLNVGRYKSAAEMLTRSSRSEEAKEADLMLLQDIQGRFLRFLGSRRRWSPEQALERVNSGPYLAQSALSRGLVDELAFEDEVESKIKTSFVKVKKVSSLPRRHWRPRLRRTPRVGLVIVDGAIVTGDSGRSFGVGPSAGADTIREQLRKARKDNRTKAIVLRINSPGGSALASDLIWHEVRKAAEKKPVVASLSIVAASGGYYIASAASFVVAPPSSVTGSIGVVGGKLSIGDLLKQQGVGVDTLKLGENADYASLTRPFSEKAEQNLQAQLEQIYELFVERVASGRDLEQAAVAEVAEGRVWTGNQATERRLVNELGGFLHAVERAKSMAQLVGPVRLVRFEQKRGWARLLGGLPISAHLPGSWWPRLI